MPARRATSTNLGPDRDSIGRLPGAEIVLEGLADLDAGLDSINANAVLMASSRLRGVGIEVSREPGSTVHPSHRLYDLLAADDPGNAHSAYNAIVRRLVSFARAAEHARAS